MDRGLGDDRLRVHANGCNLMMMDLGRATRGLGWATWDLVRATADCRQATTGHGLSA